MARADIGAHNRARVTPRAKGECADSYATPTTHCVTTLACIYLAIRKTAGRAGTLVLQDKLVAAACVGTSSVVTRA